MATRLVLAIALVLSVLAGPNRAQAQFTGVSSYAAMLPDCSANGNQQPCFPCDKWLSIEDHAQYPAMAVLLHAFGDDTTCLQKFLKRYEDRPHLVEFHFANKNCHWEGPDCFSSNRQLEEMSPETEAAIALRMFGLLATLLQHANGNTQLVLSPMLEDGLSKTAFLNYLSVLRQFWPTWWTIARSRSKGQSVSSSQFPGPFEYHSNSGKASAGCIANEDGNSNSYSQTEKFFKRYKNCLAVFAWRSEHQGYRSEKEHKLSPLRRKYSISDKDAKELGKILEAHGRN